MKSHISPDSPITAKIHDREICYNLCISHWPHN